MITQDSIIQDLQAVSQITGKPPSKPDYQKHGKFGISTVKRKFGSWNKALICSIGKVNKTSPSEPVQTNCEHCGKAVLKYPSSIMEHVFCSNSCAASFSNKRHPKRKRSRECRRCKKLILSTRTFCKDCISSGGHVQGMKFVHKKTIFESIGTGANRYRAVRAHAIKVVKNRARVCEKCGYKKHVETCHVRDISDFDPDTLIEVVNHPDNLKLLCPNCHWEHDHDNKRTKPVKAGGLGQA